jgi:hypothetical protein
MRSPDPESHWYARDIGSELQAFADAGSIELATALRSDSGGSHRSDEQASPEGRGFAAWDSGPFLRPARGVSPGCSVKSQGGSTMAKDHGSSVKDDKQYEGLRKKGMSKERAAKIANTPDASKKGGKSSGSGTRRKAKSQGGTKAQKAAAGRKGGKSSS